jgi:hypothetical protein
MRPTFKAPPASTIGINRSNRIPKGLIISNDDYSETLNSFIMDSD